MGLGPQVLGPEEAGLGLQPMKLRMEKPWKEHCPLSSGRSPAQSTVGPFLEAQRHKAETSKTLLYSPEPSQGFWEWTYHVCVPHRDPQGPL